MCLRFVYGGGDGAEAWERVPGGENTTWERGSEWSEELPSLRERKKSR